ncbi:MAG: TlpA disulfide reductase family protein [Bacteroidales bacterium]|nr:TlpA disulfide reductase family protein [Bacteroidales bacterium]
MRYQLLTLAVLTLLFTACKQTSNNTTSADTNDSTMVADVTAPTADERDYIVAVGDQLPAFTLIDMEGNTITTDDFAGKVVMLQFTASWCGVCRKEMPEIEQQIWQRHKDNDNFLLYAIDREDDYETTTHFIEKTGITYPMLRDTTATVFDRFAVHDSGITRNVIVDKNGTIVMLTRLYEPEEFQQMCQLIDSLLNE